MFGVLYTSPIEKLLFLYIPLYIPFLYISLDCPFGYVIPILVISSMFNKIFIFLDKFIPILLSMIHDSLFLSSLSLFSSFKISAYILFTLTMFLGVIELLLLLFFYIISCYIEKEI